MKDEKTKIRIAIDNSIKKPEQPWKCFRLFRFFVSEVMYFIRSPHFNIAYNNFFTFPARRVVPSPSKAITAKDQRKLDNWAINPISGGPNKKPRKLMLETAARANPGDMVLDFPARPYTIGTTHDTPIPTKRQPVTAA